MTAAELAEFGLVDIAAAIRNKKVSSVEVCTALLQRIEAFDGRINSFIVAEADSVLRAARAADAVFARGTSHGPLHGVPMAHKDLFYRKGRISTCGSRSHALKPARTTATVLRRLESSGALCLGFLNMGEFAIGPTGHNEHFGDCRNPWNVDHAPGGSSSGSGAAVAARFIYASLGSDTGGSIRVPAAACGVVGLKPTNGRVSRFGTMPRAWSLDTVGPLARDVRDCALVTQVIAGVDPADATTSARDVPDYMAATQSPIAGLKVGLPHKHGLQEADDEIRQILLSSIEVLEQAGAEIVEIELPDPAPLFRLADAIAKCESATIHGPALRRYPDDYSEHARARIDAGFHIPATAYLEAQRLRGRYLQIYLQSVFSRVDAVHLPILPYPTPRLADMAFDGSATVPGLVSALTRLTRPTNYLGLPALALPCGFSANGLPVGFQLMGQPFDEATLFALGAAYQTATDWHRRKPVVGAVQR